jgi:bacteriorhodopsin
LGSSYFGANSVGWAFAREADSHPSLIDPSSMAVLPDITYEQYNAVYNALSFGIAAMGAASFFVYAMMPNVVKKYRSALMINCLVTAIATYHYFRIFNSFDAAYKVVDSQTVGESGTQYTVSKSGTPFNDAYRYVDWFLTVPLLLLELILVMGLSPSDTTKLSWRLGGASAVMVILGYPGEISDQQVTRWIFWALAMIPFIYVVYQLLVGLGKASAGAAAAADSDSEEETGGMVADAGPTSKKAQSLIAAARYLTAVSWLTYPIVYVIKSIGLSGAQAMTYEQVGYSIADVVAKAVFGILIWAIANEKSACEEKA